MRNDWRYKGNKLNVGLLFITLHVCCFKQCKNLYSDMNDQTWIFLSKFQKILRKTKTFARLHFKLTSVCGSKLAWPLRKDDWERQNYATFWHQTSNQCLQTTWICCKVQLCCCCQSNHAYPQCAVTFRVSTMSTRDQCSAVTALAHTVTRVSPCTRAPINIATTYACTTLNQTAFFYSSQNVTIIAIFCFPFVLFFPFFFFFFNRVETFSSVAWSLWAFWCASFSVAVD